jgi:hypothetical protein
MEGWKECKTRFPGVECDVIVESFDKLFAAEESPSEMACSSEMTILKMGSQLSAEN